MPATDFNYDPTIETVEAVTGAQNALVWTLRGKLTARDNTGPFTELHPMGWAGNVVFGVNVQPQSVYAPSDPAVRAFPAVPDWEPWQQTSPKVGEIWKLKMITPVTTAMMEALEGYRAGQPMMARIQGVFPSTWTSGHALQPGVIHVTSTPWDIPERRWTEVILPRVHPPGKFIVELDLSADLAVLDDQRSSLEQARKAYYEGRYDDMARALYVLVDSLPSKPKGDIPPVPRALHNLVKSLKELLNETRHARSTPVELTKPLARFLFLAIAQGDVLRLLRNDSDQAN